MQGFWPSTIQPIRDHGAIPMVTWAPEAMGGGTNQPAFSLSQIINGAYDSYITSWATGAKNWGHPFFLRWGHEMNGNWFPWSETANGNQPGQFVQAWRHIHDIFTAVGATNVSWVWCPNVEFSGSTWPSYSSLYPGDSYVDWTGLDGYNWGPNYPSNGGWISFNNLYSRSYGELNTLAPAKPIMISEYASTENGGSKAAWITDTMSTQLPANFPKVKAVVWYNRSADGMDWPIESSASATSAYATAAQNRYFAANQYGNLNASPIPPLP
ncbi:MAG TPA: glycosyl hydrolase [Anaerolineae bacterium]